MRVMCDVNQGLEIWILPGVYVCWCVGGMLSGLCCGVAFVNFSVWCGNGLAVGACVCVSRRGSEHR